MRVLAVDDDPMTLMIVAAAVQAAGHDCLMDGLELCRRIRTQNRYTSSPAMLSLRKPS